MKEPALQIMIFFDRFANDPQTAEPYVKLFAEQPLSKIAKRPEIQSNAKKIKKEVAEATAYCRKNLEIYGRTAYIYFPRKEFAKPRYIPYLLYPQLLYMVRVFKKSEFYHLSAGQNPWRRAENKIDIGKLFNKYGGGGHFGVAAAEIKRKEDAIRDAKKIVAYLEAHRQK